MGIDRVVKLTVCTAEALEDTAPERSRAILARQRLETVVCYEF